MSFARKINMTKEDCVKEAKKLIAKYNKNHLDIADVYSAMLFHLTVDDKKSFEGYLGIILDINYHLKNNLKAFC